MIIDLVKSEILAQNFFLFFWSIIHKVKLINESIFHRLRERFWLGSSSNKGKRIDRKPDTSSLRHHHINQKILHSNIQNLFNSWLKTVDFIDKKNISCIKTIEYTNKLTWFAQCISGNYLQRGSHLLGKNPSKGCFPKST